MSTIVKALSSSACYAECPPKSAKITVCSLKGLSKMMRQFLESWPNFKLTFLQLLLPYDSILLNSPVHDYK